MQIPFWTQNGTIDLAALRPEDMSAEVLADTLSKQARFGGRTAVHWPLTSHLTLVALLCPLNLRPWALLHDANAAFLGEIMSPALELLCQAGTRAAVENAVKNAKGRLNRQIGAAWGVAVRSESLTLLQADRIAVQAEAHVLLGVTPAFITPTDPEIFAEAVDFIRSNVGHPQASREIWLAQIEHHAHRGHMTPPPVPVPPSSVLAG